MDNKKHENYQKKKLHFCKEKKKFRLGAKFSVESLKLLVLEIKLNTFIIIVDSYKEIHYTVNNSMLQMKLTQMLIKAICMFISIFVQKSFPVVRTSIQSIIPIIFIIHKVVDSKYYFWIPRRFWDRKPCVSEISTSSISILNHLRSCILTNAIRMSWLIIIMDSIVGKLDVQFSYFKLIRKDIAKWKEKRERENNFKNDFQNFSEVNGSAATKEQIKKKSYKMIEH